MKVRLRKNLTLFLAFGMMFAGGGESFAQEKTISGTVSDESGALPGVSIIIKGTSTGTETDFDGKYSIKAKAGDVLSFSYIGYVTAQRTVGVSNTINVTLVVDENVLDEVVVTALGISKEKRSLGYDVSTISAERIKEGGETNIVNSLAGKTSGVQITSSSGSAGAASYIKIRGNASLTGGNQPLFVIDGIPVTNEGGDGGVAGVALSNRMADINPDDIESVNILKGGAATAAYGSRAANGVVLITTKGGKYNSKIKVTFNSSLEISEVNKLPKTNLIYSQGRDGNFRGGTTEGGSWGPAISELGYDANGEITGTASDIVAGTKGTVPSGNPKDFFQKGIKRLNGATISGGGEKVKYFLSLSNLDEKGIVPLNTFKRNNLSVSVTTELNDKLTAGASLKYANTKGRRIQQGSNTSGLMLGLLRTPPSFDNSNGATDPTDTKAFLNSDGTQRNYRDGVGYDNPYWTVNMSPYVDEVNRIIGNVNLYKIYFYITQIICIFPQKKMGRSTRKISGYSSSEIKALFKTEDKYKIRIRLYAVYQISLGKPSRELEVLYNTSFKQILNWASRFEKEGIEGLRDKKGRGRKSKLTDAQKEQLKEVVLKKSPENYGYNTSTWNGPLLIDWLNKHMGVFYQRAQIYNVLKSLGLTYQKSKGFYPEADKEKQSIFKETLKKNFLNLL